VHSRQARRDLVEWKLRQHRNAVEGLLPVHCNIVAERLQRLARERVVDTLGFLQADHVRLPLRQPGGPGVHSVPDPIDVPGGEAQGSITCGWLLLLAPVTTAREGGGILGRWCW